MKIGYVRCSTDEQNEGRQLKMMEDNGVERIFIDKKSGKDTKREEFKRMMSFVRDGDTLITESISRLARSTKDLLNIVDVLEEKGVQLISLKENLDTKTPSGRFMLTIFAALAQLERENMLERQREGIEIAKAAGKYKGRKPVYVDEKRFRTLCSRWRKGELRAVEVMRMMDLKPNTFYRRVQELGL